jgi:hypothetical protein
LIFRTRKLVDIESTKDMLVNTLEPFLKRYSEIREREHSADSTIADLSAFLDEYDRVFDSLYSRQRICLMGNRHNFGTLLAEYENVFEVWRNKQEATADDFNVLEVIGLTFDEIRHSMLLAWLLDHRIGKLGSHAQGNLGFCLFLKSLRLPLKYASANYSVSREVAGNSSRVDIRVEATGRFIIDIENKIWSDEGDDQTNREWVDLLTRAKQLCVPASAVHAFFLTPEGRLPRNRNFDVVTWHQVAEVLDEFSEQAKPTEVKLFAKHYAAVLRRFVLAEVSERDTNNGEQTV